ncbi:hypothetical protein MNBD_ALPHA12-846 [hydrothermal vent metagenome]|uniref:Uncharacterized protein n=1 Tax=hydrothermal vent metagenome TaxID=652676 RepID=A0A3B0T9N3_9ZZZZ
MGKAITGCVLSAFAYVPFETASERLPKPVRTSQAFSCGSGSGEVNLVIRLETATKQKPRG